MSGPRFYEIGPRVIDSRVLEKLNAEPPSEKIPRERNYHLVVGGDHYWMVTGFQPTVELDDGKLELNMRHRKYSYEDVRKQNKKIDSVDKFIHILNKRFPLIYVTAEEVARTPKVKEDFHPFDVGGITTYFSQELRQGLLGGRADDHMVTTKLLKNCIKKKLRAIRNGKAEHYLYDKGKKRVLLLVLNLNRSEQLKRVESVIIKTAYYPTDSYLRYQLNNPSASAYESWESNLPRV